MVDKTPKRPPKKEETSQGRFGKEAQKREGRKK